MDSMENIYKYEMCDVTLFIILQIQIEAIIKNRI